MFDLRFNLHLPKLYVPFLSKNKIIKKGIVYLWDIYGGNMFWIFNWRSSLPRARLGRILGVWADRDVDTMSVVTMQDHCFNGIKKGIIISWLMAWSILSMPTLFFAPQIESYCAMFLPKPICQKFLFRLVHLVRLTISPRKLWPRLIIVHLRTWCVWHAPKASIQVGLAGNQVAWPN